MTPSEGFSFPSWQVSVWDSTDAVVSAGHSRLGFHPGRVPEARAAFPQRKELLFVCVQMVCCPTPESGRLWESKVEGSTGGSFPGEEMLAGLRRAWDQWGCVQCGHRDNPCLAENPRHPLHLAPLSPSPSFLSHVDKMALEA